MADPGDDRAVGDAGHDRAVGQAGHGFTHLDERGRARMVDVTAKAPTRRRAVARARVTMSPETATAIGGGEVGKGDVLAVARVAGIQGAKRTSELIPLCHPVMIGSAEVAFTIGPAWVDIEAVVETVGPTGVEMEALTACSIAALTIYDMCKARDRAMTVTDLGLWHKSGGRSGIWERAAGPTRDDAAGGDATGGGPAGGAV